MTHFLKEFIFIIVYVNELKRFLWLFYSYFFLLIQKDEVYLNLVMEFVPENVYRVARHYSKSKQTIPILYIKVSVKSG